ncbi:MAG: hypothetical protein RDV48_06680 [Candidatus Eremiobacteraeota bacterium]|nr:hypothetical protein [Candidatus Eremiobacteraeota bacterium]
MKVNHVFFMTALFFVLSAGIVLAGANNNTPSDAFQSYQIALRDEDTSLLKLVYSLPQSARSSQSRLMQELKQLKYYDSYKNYAVVQVIDQGDSAKLKVKGTLRGREGVKRTFQLKRFNDGWKITQAWNY